MQASSACDEHVNMAKQTSLARDEHVNMAKLCGKANSYKDMLEFMKKVCYTLTDFEELTAEERDLLSVAYKSVVGALRVSWGNVSSKEVKESVFGHKEDVTMIKDYRSKFEEEISDLCHGLLDLLDYKLIPSAGSVVSKVFYLKMKADYLAELKSNPERTENAQCALDTYTKALDIAMAELAPADLLRLSVAHNYSIFLYYILKKPAHACSIARKAYCAAAPYLLETIGLSACKDTNFVIRSLGRNASHWKSVMKEQKADEIKEANTLRSKRN